MAEPDQIDDLCDARSMVRILRQEVLKRRLALVEAKEKLSNATDRLEDVLTEIEQHQGRLPFADDQPAAPEAAPANGRASKRRSEPVEVRP